MPTPARRAISSTDASMPCSENASRAAATMRSRFAWASRRRGRTMDVEPDPQDPHGYPGWLPAKQLAFGEWALAGRAAIVETPSTWLSLPGRRIELSFATRLPVVRVDAATVVVRTPGGGRGTLARSAVRIVRAPGHPSGAQIVATARRFLGIRYLWGGLSF